MFAQRPRRRRPGPPRVPASRLRAMFAELAINAIMHKDYSRPGYVGIYVYADRMTFVNHNWLLPP